MSFPYPDSMMMIEALTGRFEMLYNSSSLASTEQFYYVRLGDLRRMSDEEILAEFPQCKLLAHTFIQSIVRTDNVRSRYGDNGIRDVLSHITTGPVGSVLFYERQFYGNILLTNIQHDDDDDDNDDDDGSEYDVRNRRCRSLKYVLEYARNFNGNLDLDLSDNNLVDHDLEILSVIAALPNVKVLRLRNCRIHFTIASSTAHMLSMLENLEFLDIVGNPQLDTDYLKNLANGSDFVKLRRLIAVRESWFCGDGWKRMFGDDPPRNALQTIVDAHVVFYRDYAVSLVF